MRLCTLACSFLGGLLIVSHLGIAEEPLMDWSPWEKYRSTVRHPAGYINAQDVGNARANIARYDWAKDYARRIEDSVAAHLEKFTPEFLEDMIPSLSIQRAFGFCPACRDQGKPTTKGGWRWSIADPDHINCRVCGTVFPNDDYAETVVLECKSEAGKGQSFSYYGGDPFRAFGGYHHLRPSFSGEVRRCKAAWCRGVAHSAALAYALTGKPEYGELVRKILLRYADVYPHWLLISDYGEIADMDPHIAALNLDHLPADELVYPPNKPDRRTHNSYWQTGRTGGGADAQGGFTQMMLQTYELTYHAKKANGAPLYAEEERIKIERDLLMESCIHLFAYKSINNKSVSGRKAVGMVGVALGHPGFVRFGLEGWQKTMDEWFLADGCTPESPGYAMMTLGGIYTFAQAMRGYSDPPAYTDEKGERIENLNLYEGKYKLVWQRMVEGLQGNLRFPPYADALRSARIGRHFAELLAANYPGNPQYLALLKAYAGSDLSKGMSQNAVFFLPPGLEERETPPLRFDDNFFPILCLGQLRTGEHGRRSLTLLSATHWGGHHHRDSLNLYYWKDGRELLTDLGYLWDHPKSGMTNRTFAHNTGLVDLAPQKTKGRGGLFHLFHTGGRAKVMEASSQAYDKADVYRRTVVQIEHSPENAYLVDIFRIRALGSRDLVYHGPNSECDLSGIELVDGDVRAEARDMRFGLRFHVGGLTDEIFVDDVSIKLSDGTEAAVNPSVTDIDEKTGKPVGWNHYSGDGAAEWGVSSPGRSDKHCAYLKVTGKPKKRLNQALMHGDTKGYTGANALKMPEGSKGKVSFWIRGRAAVCNVQIVTWPNDPKSANDRHYVPLAPVPVTEQWVQHTAEFARPKVGMDLENVKSAASPDTWSARWQVAEDMQLSAYHCGQPGEIAYIGDGWGQRDWRNSDLGATIPYIVRRHQPDAGVSAFCTVYEGHKPDAGVVKSASRLAVPEERRDRVVALAIETKLGTDIVVSQLEPAEIEIDIRAGRLRTDAAVAVMSVRDGRVAFTAIAEGSTLRLNGEELPVETLQPNSALGEQLSAGPVSALPQEPWAKPMWVVHRGGEDGVPENTMVAIKRSVELGAQYIEIDLRATADGKIVLLHDDALDRATNGAGKLSEHTWEQIKDLDAGSWKDPEFSHARIPLLSEVLAYCKKHKVKILLDIKDPKAAGASLYKLLEKHEMVQDARVYMRAAAGRSPVKEALDPRLVRFAGSLVQPWGKTPPVERMRQAQENDKSMGALLRSYRHVLEFSKNQ